MSIVEELSGSESLEIEAPTTEPERQYYFIEKAKDIFAEKCKEADRTLTFCVTTFGCQMNAVSENL